MSELSTVAKAMFALGFTAVLAVMIFGTSGPTLAPNPTSPQFNNPFSKTGYSSEAQLIQGWNFITLPSNNNLSGSGNQCGNITYYVCLQDEAGPDFNQTYFTLNAANVSQFNFSNGFYSDFSARPGVYAQGVDWTRFNSFRVDLWCRWITAPSNGNTTIAIVFSQYLDARNVFAFGANANNTCPVGNWGQSTFIAVFSGNAPNDANAKIIMDIDTSFFTPDGFLAVSTAYIQVSFSGNSQCTGNGFFGDLSCQIGNFFQPVINAIGLVVGILLFIGQGLYAGIIFLTNFFLVIRWLYGIPGLPNSVQLFVSSYVTTLFGIIIITLVKLLRGGSP